MEDAYAAPRPDWGSGAAAAGAEEAEMLFGRALERVRAFRAVHGRLPEAAGGDEPDEPILGAWLEHQRHRRTEEKLPPWKDNELSRALGSMWWNGQDGGRPPLPYH